jgi:ubiquitin-protein ligase
MSKRVHTTASARLKQDYLRIKKDPVPYVTASPLPTNILEWYVYMDSYVFYSLVFLPVTRLFDQLI